MRQLIRRRDHDRAQELVEHGSITRWNACKGKLPYPNQNHARAAAKQMARRHDRPFDTYKCPFCESYHITKVRIEELDDEGEE